MAGVFSNAVSVSDAAKAGRKAAGQGYVAGRVEDAYGMLLDAVMLDPMAVRAALEDGDLRSIREAYPDLEKRLMAVAPTMPGDTVGKDEAGD